MPALPGRAARANRYPDWKTARRATVTPAAARARAPAQHVAADRRKFRVDICAIRLSVAPDRAFPARVFSRTSRPCRAIRKRYFFPLRGVETTRNPETRRQHCVLPAAGSCLHRRATCHVAAPRRRPVFRIPRSTATSWFCRIRWVPAGSRFRLLQPKMRAIRRHAYRPDTQNSRCQCSRMLSCVKYMTFDRLNDLTNTNSSH